MKNNRWLLYGATGYTGNLIAREAKSQGLSPVLAGRSLEKLKPLAKELGFEAISFDLSDENTIYHQIKDFDVVLHSAGPFIYTSNIMIRACIKAGVNYVDVTGEIPVFENTFNYDIIAKEKSVALISGSGFDVVPTDCLAKYVSEAVPDATELELAFSAQGSPSAGTLKSMVEMIPKGGLVRKNGSLQSLNIGEGSKKIRFSQIGEKTAVPIPWGDLATAFVSTKIPNITTYMTYPEPIPTMLPFLSPILKSIAGTEFVREAMKKAIETFVWGPSEEVNQTGSTHVYARASSSKNFKEAWLDCAEGYRFTALSAIATVKKIISKRPVGALTPSLAFGKDFVLEIPGSRRYDELK